MGLRELCAHSPASPDGGWDRLVDHLTRVAELAAAFANRFGKCELGYLIGCCHDLGKANPEFQAYLQACHEKKPHLKIPHAIWGSAFVYRLIRPSEQAWKTISIPIHGHHAGLPHGGELSQHLFSFLARTPAVVNVIQPLFSAVIREKRIPEVSERGTRLEFLIRMLFSALVDADYLDTEHHFQPTKAEQRIATGDFARLWDDFERAQNTLAKHASIIGGRVNEVRADVYST
jgi:CRISPR-associated endonuclease/helicase Cas3